MVSADELANARSLAAAASEELERRRLRTLFARRGQRGEDGVLRGGLMDFVRHFWYILEPATDFVDGWPLWAIVEHLEAVSYNEINRLLINVPPGFSKSLLTNSFWPAWEWAVIQSSTRYVTFSYASTLTERDNGRFRAIVSCPEYQDLFPHVVLERFGDVKIANTVTGWKFASSVEGVGTGERGDRVLCFPGDTVVRTSIGPISIEDIVGGRLRVEVPSVDISTGKVGLKPVTGWHFNPGSALVEVLLSDGVSFRCTPDHRIWTRGGWVAARLLGPSDRIPRFPVFDIHDALARDPELSGENTGRQRGTEDVHDLVIGKLGPRASFPFVDVGGEAEVIGNARPGLPSAYLADHIKADPVAPGKNLGILSTLGNFGRLLASKYCPWALLKKRECPVELGVVDVLGTSSIAKVGEYVISRIAIKMADFMSWGRRATERLHHGLVDKDIFPFIVAPCIESGVSAFTGGGVENFLGKNQGATSPSWDTARLAAYSPEGGDTVNAFESDDRFPLLVRECGHVDKTFCLTVDGNNTFFVGEGNSVLVSNCDDPHKVNESKFVIDKTVEWFRQAMLNRLNDQERSAVVVIMQRIHEVDVSGVILSKGMDFTHLMIPMEYDPGRHCETSIGWSDPRSVEGELAWPERFPQKVIAQLKHDLGPSAYASQYSQSPTPVGAGIIPRDSWQLWQSPTGVFPPVEFVVASLDGAFTEKEENDPSALTVWGVWTETVAGVKRKRIVLMRSWAKYLPFSGDRVLCSRRPNEALSAWRWRTRAHWGLMEWVKDTCDEVGVDVLLIENKGPGISAAQEMQMRFGELAFSIQLVKPKGDKVARAYSVQPLFTQGVVYAPDKDWAEEVIDQCERFPKAAHDDLVDSTTQALRWIRDNGLAASDEEVAEQARRSVAHSRKPGAIYPC